MIVNNINNSLSKILNVDPVNTEMTVVPTENFSVANNSIEDDAKFAQENIKSLIQTGTEALRELSLVAKHSEQPRAYEVIATMIKNVSDLNKDLLEIQKRKKDLTTVATNKDVNIDKAVFVGSTAELMKLIKNKQE